MKTQKQSEQQTGLPWRLKLGIAVFIVGFLSPLLIPVVKSIEIPTAWKVTISGALAVGVPEIFAIVAVAIMGKPGFNAMKAYFFKMVKPYSPPDQVSHTRYRIGLVMFVLPLLFGWLAPYVPSFIPGYDLQVLMANMLGDIMFISSLFVLGGNFWDKVRALFVHDATTKFPDHLIV
ncbi:transporter suffix domain-containing protein [Thermodesulfobacteriota bacterium]